MKFYLSLVLVNLFYCGLASKNLPISGKPTTPTTKVAADLPLNVTVTNIGDNYAVFNITGADTVGGLPVVDLNVEYTIGNQSVATQVKTVLLSSSDGSAMLQELVKITDLKAGLNYHFKFSAENAKKETGPPSRDVSVLLLPPTPDITVEHPQTNKLVVKWGENRAKSEDYFLLTVEKKSALGCGITLNITSCFGNKYTIDDLEVGEVYQLTMRAHNPTGFSEPVVVSYPID